MPQHVEGPEPDHPWFDEHKEVLPGLSQDLLDRARVGWERFVSTFQEPAGD
ncbi:hypothetical protein ACFCXA_08175 [Streptomyces virginiae]|uniref:hypothetical protein n=1 Tax=Streptomyces virginiae TaxID=1961 RepID=UPI003244DFFD